MNELMKAQIICDIASRLSAHGWVGKTHIQKAVYLAQQAARLDLGFRYVIHHYGPYSFELNSFLESLSYLGYIKMAREPDGYGYSVTADQSPGAISDADTKTKVQVLAKVIAGKTASDLELISTCVYIDDKYPHEEDNNRIEYVTRLKPRFRRDAIRMALHESRNIVAAFRS